MIKLEPFFFFPHGAQHTQLDRALKRCSGQVDDVSVRRMALVLTHRPSLIETEIGVKRIGPFSIGPFNFCCGNKKVFVNSRD